MSGLEKNVSPCPRGPLKYLGVHMHEKKKKTSETGLFCSRTLKARNVFSGKMPCFKKKGVVLSKFAQIL